MKSSDTTDCSTTSTRNATYFPLENPLENATNDSGKKGDDAVEVTLIQSSKCEEERSESQASSPTTSFTSHDLETNATSNHNNSLTVGKPVIVPNRNAMLLPERPTSEVARDTKRILEICYGNETSKSGHINEEESTVASKTIELHHGKKPSKKKKSKVLQNGDGEASSTGDKKQKTVTKKKKKATTTISNDHQEASATDKKEGDSDASQAGKVKKKRKKKKFITVTTIITNEDGTTTTIKKRKRRKKKKPAIQRDAAGRIVRKRRKIKNRHRVVRKEFIKKGKDAKIDLPTIEEGFSSDEDSSSCSGDSDSDSDFEDSTTGDSLYTLETMHTYDSGEEEDEEEYRISGEEGDNDEEEYEVQMMVVNEDDEDGERDEHEEDKDTKTPKNGVTDTIETFSTKGSCSAHLGPDVEAASTPISMKLETLPDEEQPRDRSFGTTDTEETFESGKGILFWSRRKLLFAGLLLVSLIAGVVFVIVYFVTAKEPAATPSPTSAPTKTIVPPTASPTISPTTEPTTMLNTSSTVCQLPGNETAVLVLQAEDADYVLGAATTDNETTGFCGDGYVTDFINEESSISFFPVAVNRTGFYRVALRYSSGGDEDLPLQLWINDGQISDFRLLPTGNWSIWMVEGIDDVLLRKGKNNTIEVRTTIDRENGPSVDWLSLRFQGSITRFEYLTTLLSPFTNVTNPSQTQISALVWMSTEDPMDWDSISDREIIERYSLVNFYVSTEGDLWSVNNEWLSGFHTCDWFGVACSADSIVTDLILDANGLFGTIPDDLYLLSSMVTISLNTNSLEGTVGSAIGQLLSLTHLLLEANFLTGPIPQEIGSMKRLVVLHLGSNEMNGKIPTTIYGLSSLESLVLSTNNFEGPLTTEVGQLISLEMLNVQSNGLTGELVTELGRLTNLTTLILGLNQFSGTIPSELGMLTDLQFLDLSSNQLSGQVPNEVKALMNETIIDYYGNAIRDPR